MKRLPDLRYFLKRLSSSDVYIDYNADDAYIGKA
jgi:hypothetical protein